MLKNKGKAGYAVPLAFFDVILLYSLSLFRHERGLGGKLFNLRKLKRGRGSKRFEF